MNKGETHRVDYTPLYTFFAKQTSPETTLTFKEIETILGDDLPPSAYDHPQWWSNSKTEAHPHSHAWQDSGYKTTGYSSSIWKHKITFVKVQHLNSISTFEIGTPKGGRATYKEIQEYVKNKYGFVVKTCWIAHMKEICGLPVKMANNRYSPSDRTNPCPKGKQDAICDAFKHFKMI